MASLLEFWNDKETLENVRAFLLQETTEEAVRRVFSREDCGGLADAREIIENAFAKMDSMFEKGPKQNIINEAR